ncbi:Coiled-coil domain-containing protein 148 [Labeo rohita]|uniref:Coiled-coil domain-containing protein 148 n=1 Tax=Labeo rohita TaxID=84645 RepID=A0ABQ8MCK9_LABRO|nr:Coiled-coil domain-containing protein 148 [Labeo rohita]
MFIECTRHKTEKDLQSFLHGVGFKEEADTDILSQLHEYELDLEQEHEEFRLTTVEPVYQLRDDLQYRLASQCSKANDISELKKVLQQVQSVRQQQEEVMDKLQHECENLLSAAMEDQVAYFEKVPDEIFTADWPYPDLRSDLIHSFYSLTEKYKLRLAIVETRLQGLNRNCGWNAADHECFQHIMSQYSPSMRNQHSLYIDMVQRMLPHVTKQELKNLVLQGWQRDRSELLLRALSMLEDCRISHIKQQELQKQHSHQQNICLKLRVKVFTFAILRYCHYGPNLLNRTNYCYSTIP